MNRPDPNTPDSGANQDDAVWLDLVARLEAGSGTPCHERNAAFGTCTHYERNLARRLGKENESRDHAEARDAVTFIGSQLREVTDESLAKHRQQSALQCCDLR